MIFVFADKASRGKTERFVLEFHGTKEQAEAYIRGRKDKYPLEYDCTELPTNSKTPLIWCRQSAAAPAPAKAPAADPEEDIDADTDNTLLAEGEEIDVEVEEKS